MITRRAFLRSAALAAAAATLRPALAVPGPMPLLVGSQMYGWGQYFARDKKPFDLDEVLSALRDMGYDYAENSTSPNNLAADASSFAEKLRSRGLKPLSMYTGGRLHDDKGAGVAAAIATAASTFRRAGFTILVCNPDPIGRAKTDAELNTQAKNLDLIGAELKKAGVFFAVHNHTPEMADHAKEFHSNFDKTNPASVRFCYDVHWVYRGGIQPADALAQYANRVVTWHLRQSRNQVWWEDLDNGDVDYAWIAQFAKQHHLPRYYTIELALENATKMTRSAIDNHRRSLDFVRKTMA